MFEDQSSAVEKIYSMEVGEKEECWKEERKKEKNSVRLPSGYKPRRPTPDPSVHLKPLCRKVAVSAKSRSSEKLGFGKSLKSWSQLDDKDVHCNATTSLKADGLERDLIPLKVHSQVFSNKSKYRTSCSAFSPLFHFPIFSFPIFHLTKNVHYNLGMWIKTLRVREGSIKSRQ